MKKPRIHQDDVPGGLTHNPFAALRGSAAPTEPSVPSVSEPASKAPGRIVVQREKKGRAGKTVTRITGFTRELSQLGDLARDLKRALGCGASIEDHDILLQGALTDRAASWLRERFGVEVTIGN